MHENITAQSKARVISRNIGIGCMGIVSLVMILSPWLVTL